MPRKFGVVEREHHLACPVRQIHLIDGLMTAVPRDIILEQNSCPLCAEARSQKLFEGADLLHALPGRFAVVACVDCGLKRTSPRPTPEAIGYYYPDEYGAYLNTAVFSDPTVSTGWRSIVNFAKGFFDTKANATPTMVPGRMMEIGCATGTYLHQMAQQGWRVEGIEFSANAADEARQRGYQVEIGSVEMADRDDNQFDLIAGWMVLEHLHDPLLALTKMRKWIREDGQLAISVPDSGGYEFTLFTEHWYALQLPTHLFHYDKYSISKLLEKSGWRVTRIQHQRTMANFIGSTGYWLRSHGWTRMGNLMIEFPERGGRIGALLVFPVSWIMAKLGLTGRMTIWAKPI